jgi:fumarate reductase flavoprotein subunit
LGGPGAQVQQLRRSGGRYLVTYETQPDGATHTLPADAVVLATGGFGASKQLLGKHAPQVADLATTNGPFAVGDGLKLAQSAGIGHQIYLCLA